MHKKIFSNLGILSGIMVLSFLIPGTVGAATNAELEARIVALEAKLAYLTVNAGTINGLSGPHVIFSGANVHIRNGTGTTNGTVNGTGNVIVGYNEAPSSPIRGGSHNVLIGSRHNYSSYGGLVAGEENTVSGISSTVSGGRKNVASGFMSSVNGGINNTASGTYSSISGGGNDSSQQGNIASGYLSSVSGGAGNTASGQNSSVSGGNGNTAGGVDSSVYGGERNRVNGRMGSMIGGYNNTANGEYSAVFGGTNITANGTFKIGNDIFEPYMKLELGTINGLASPNIIFEGANIHVLSGGNSSLGNFKIGPN